MRKSYNDVGWLVTEDGRMAGFSLGYDRCAEHEWGVAGILAQLGIELPEVPLGVGDRQMTELPESLRFVEYKAKPRDKRRKAYPAAFLVMHDRWYEPKDQVDTNLMDREAAFWNDPTDPRARPEDSIQAAWNGDSFCIHVRGDENIERLKALHEAFLRKDIAVALPWARSFFRGGLSLAIPSAMTDAEKQSVLDQDLAHKKLADAAAATGIVETLKAAGKRWHALSPDWTDREAQTEVAFFLNPWEQSKCNYGWFTVDELREWAQDKGPVIRHAALETFAKEPENYDWSYRLIAGMEKQSVRLRFGARLVWFDEAAKVPGLKVMVSKSTPEGLLASGTYRFEELMSRFALPLQSKTTEAVAQAS